MGMPSCEIDHAAIVLVGSFNPSIFQPLWMAKEGLVADDEAKDAKISVIIPDAAAFELGGWLKVDVARERFEAIATSARAPALLDFVSGLFRVLEHSRISLVAITRAMHFKMESMEIRNALGTRLAPPTVWPEVMERPRMGSIRMQYNRAGGGLVHASVEPSAQIVDVGVFVSVVEQFPIEGDAGGADKGVELVQKHFDDSFRHGRLVADALVATGGAHG